MLQVSRTEEEGGPFGTRLSEGFERLLKCMDTRLEENEWFAGEEFTAADVMIVFSLTTMRVFFPFDLSAYGAILKYLDRVARREGYRRARAKADPELELMVEGKAPRSLWERLKAEEGKI